MRHLIFLLFTCTLLSACTCGFSGRKDLFYNRDSILFYGERAYAEDDPYALYVTAAASLVAAKQPDFPDSIYTIPTDEAELLLLYAAELGSPEALSLIHDLSTQGRWDHYIPEK